jgi:hypothetical protein
MDVPRAYHCHRAAVTGAATIAAAQIDEVGAVATATADAAETLGSNAVRVGADGGNVPIAANDDIAALSTGTAGAAAAINGATIAAIATIAGLAQRENAAGVII